MIVLSLRPNRTAMTIIQLNPSGPVGDAYMAARNGNVLTGLAHEFYTAQLETDTNDLETVFDIANGQKGDFHTCPSIIRWNGISQSMSVGDVAVNVDTEEAWVCAPMGWTAVTEPDLLCVLLSIALRFQASSAPRQARAA